MTSRYPPSSAISRGARPVARHSSGSGIGETLFTILMLLLTGAIIYIGYTTWVKYVNANMTPAEKKAQEDEKILVKKIKEACDATAVILRTDHRTSSGICSDPSLVSEKDCIVDYKCGNKGTDMPPTACTSTPPTGKWTQKNTWTAYGKETFTGYGPSSSGASGAPLDGENLPELYMTYGDFK